MKNTFEILNDLIAIPSYVDETNNEKGVIEYIINLVHKHKPSLKIEKQHVENERYNLIISESENPKIMLFGHMDTVQPKAEAEKPFEARRIDDRIYGLGSVDMKSGLAIMLDILINYHNKHVGYVFSVDEEYEFKGVFHLSNNFKLKPEIIINVEPTDLKILNGCRGITEFSYIAKGKSTHASRKDIGVNAIEKAVQLTALLQNCISEYDSTEKGKNSLNLSYIHGGTFKSLDANNKPVLSDLGNVVPNYAKLNCEIRVSSSAIDKEFLKNKIGELADKLNIEISDLNFKFYLGSMHTPKNELSDLEKAVKKSDLKITYANINESGYYEAQVLQEKLGCKCVMFGPGPAAKSHMSDEYVEVLSVEKAQHVLEKYIESL